MSAPTDGRAGAVLALYDRTRAGLHAAWRAAFVARDLGTHVRLLHAPPGGAGAPALQAAAQLAAEIAARVGVDVMAHAFEGDPLQALVQESPHAALLVLGSTRGNPLREWVSGTQAERLIRLSRVPVLVVKRDAAAGYRRILVPVELSADASEALDAANAVAGGSQIELLHVLDPQATERGRLAEVPEAVLRLHRQEGAQAASLALQGFIARAGIGDGRAVAAVSYGEAAAQVASRAVGMRADLVVIRKRGGGLLADFVLGGVTQRVLAATRCDVLVLRSHGVGGAGGDTPARDAEAPRREEQLAAG